MIAILPQSTPTCLVVRFSGSVTREDYQHFLDAISERLPSGDRVSMVAELTEFKLYDDLEVAKLDMKFAFAEYKHIHRAAYVGDQKWLVWFTRLISPFTRVEEKHFPEGQVEAAINWAAA